LFINVPGILIVKAWCVASSNSLFQTQSNTARIIGASIVKELQFLNFVFCRYEEVNKKMFALLVNSGARGDDYSYYQTTSEQVKNIEFEIQPFPECHAALWCCACGGVSFLSS
jgi:hypothetical protein